MPEPHAPPAARTARRLQKKEEKNRTFLRSQVWRSAFANYIALLPPANPNPEKPPYRGQSRRLRRHKLSFDNCHIRDASKCCRNCAVGALCYEPKIHPSLETPFARERRATYIKGLLDKRIAIAEARAVLLAAEASRSKHAV